VPPFFSSVPGRRCVLPSTCNHRCAAQYSSTSGCCPALPCPALPCLALPCLALPAQACSGRSACVRRALSAARAATERWSAAGTLSLRSFANLEEDLCVEWVVNAEPELHELVEERRSQPHPRQAEHLEQSEGLAHKAVYSAACRLLCTQRHVTATADRLHRLAAYRASTVPCEHSAVRAQCRASTVPCQCMPRRCRQQQTE
jgi:hypothetical protein